MVDCYQLKCKQSNTYYIQVTNLLKVDTTLKFIFHHINRFVLFITSIEIGLYTPVSEIVSEVGC